MQITLDSVVNLVSTLGPLEIIRNLIFGALDDTTKLIFFQRINEFMKDEIAEFGVNLLTRTMQWVGIVSVSLMTIWVFIQGYRIVTGQSRDSMMALVVNALKMTLVVALATGFSIGGSSIFKILSDDLPNNIYEVVSGNTGNIYQDIDQSLGYMQLAFSSIDALQDGDSQEISGQKTRAMWFTGIGTGGPAITAAIMLLLNRIAMALFVGLGPIFILCLMFDQTKQLFGKWLFYGVGAMFSLAVLSVMVTLAMDVILAVASSFWVGNLIQSNLAGGNPEGVNSMAMQQGGLGLLLTMLMISAPPIAANFFQGTMGQFLAHSQFGVFGGSSGSSNSSQAGTRGPGSPPADSPAPRTSDSARDPRTNSAPLGGQPNYSYTGGTTTASTDTLRAADQTSRGYAAINPPTANTAPPLANNTAPTVINPPVLPPPPSGAGGPPRGGTG
jgi:type IV secretion system protein VirB6